MKAVICPLCEGTGIYAHPPQKSNDRTTTTYGCSTCHGCSGKGWVEVKEECHYTYHYYNPFQPWYTPEYPQY